ncbi:hypothetical protein [Rhodococcus sp. HNM0569]|uniref:hypothetical protein n=1 Tax=Rhodococcus sp. HNM0569 TaxID=2716340 RepID=UPI001F0F1F94|nr:hypothetical protein [Rhodococcus sp. HNM0569]
MTSTVAVPSRRCRELRQLFQEEMDAMPRKQEHTNVYADALTALETAAHRPASVVNVADDYAIRVDFEFSRHLLATNTGSGLADDPSLIDDWTVGIYQDGPDGPVLLAQAKGRWLVDAYDATVAELVRQGVWTGGDAGIAGSAAEVVSGEPLLATVVVPDSAEGESAQ